MARDEESGGQQGGEAEQGARAPEGERAPSQAVRSEGERRWSLARGTHRGHLWHFHFKGWLRYTLHT